MTTMTTTATKQQKQATPKPPKPPKQQNFATAPAERKQTPLERLRDAEAEGYDGVMRFIRDEQKTRDNNAINEWAGYALWRPADRNHWTHVITPEGNRYTHRMGAECTHRFEDCPDQVLCDKANDAARRFGVVLRLEPKHKEISHLIERAVFAGLREWKRCAATEGWGEGFVTVPVGGQTR